MLDVAKSFSFVWLKSILDELFTFNSRLKNDFFALQNRLIKNVIVQASNFDKKKYVLASPWKMEKCTHLLSMRFLAFFVAFAKLIIFPNKVFVSL